MPSIFPAKYTILILLLFIFVISGASALEETVANEVYETTVIEQHKILYKYLPKYSHSNKTLVDDIKLIYPIGEPLSQRFKEAGLILTSDGIAAVQLVLSKANLPEIFTLTGTWGTQNGTTQLHVAGTETHGLKITMDGLLEPSNSGFHMDGIFSATVRDARHVEQIVLQLGKNPDPSENKWGLLIIDIDEARKMTAFNQSIREEEHLSSEPTEWIGGVPVPTSFDVILEVKLDGIKLKPMKGQLLLNKVEGLAEPTVGILLGPEGSMVAGSSVWTTSQSALESSKSKDPSVKVTTNTGHIRVAITSPPPFGETYWFTRNPEHPDEDAQVLVDEGMIDIQLDKEGKKVSGTINAKGKVLAGSRPVSTFSAELSGKQQGRDLVESVASYVGARPFDGRWNDPKIGELSLHQQRDKVSGKFSSGSIEEGIVTGSVLNFLLKTPTGGSHKGFLSAASDGLLVGITWNENRNLPFEPVVAVQVPPTDKSNSKTSIVFAIKNDEEARELKFLGYDLSFAGKHQEAAKILLQVVKYYHASEASSKNDPTAYQKITSNLINQALPLNSLISDAFEAGDYPTLVQALRMSLHVQSELEKGKANPRSFREHVEKYIVKLNKSLETMDKLKAGFDRGLISLSASWIGIDFEKEPNAAGIKISGVRSDMSASQAGVAVGDLIVAIDGIIVAGMNSEQASISLRGNAGSSVSIKLLRDGQYRELKLVRTPLFNMSSEQREELAKSINSIRNFVADTSNYYRTEANKLNQLSNEATDMSVAFEKLTASIKEHQKSVEGQRSTAIALAERCLAESPLALSLFQRFVSLQNVMTRDRKLDDENTARMLRLDQEEEAFEQNPDVSEMDKGLLVFSMLMVAEFDLIRENANSRLKLVKHVVESSSQSPDALKTANTLAGLASRLDNWRSRMLTDAAKIESLNLGQDFYADYVQVLLGMNLPEQALEASEAARARAFADLLASRQKMQGNLDQATHSEGVLLNPASAPPLSIQEIKDIAAAQGGTLIEYFLMKDGIAIWAISPKGEIDVIRVPVDINQLKANIERLAVLMGPDGLSSEDGRELRPEAAELLRRLDESLIAPLEKKNLLPSDFKTVVTIVPHGSLFGVPFAALRDGKNQYFIEKYPLSYATSLSVLKYTQKNQNGNTSNEKQRHLLALVSPDPLPNSEKLQKKTLVSLPETAKLFRKYIAGFYAPEEIRNIHFGRDATETVLRENASHADVLYFATHAEINGKEPLKSFIALAKTEQSSGHFRVADVYGLNLKAELAILAACETGGGSVSGDGVDGLSRAFTQAGASALLMSLWEIPEETTTRAMIGFHQFWLQEKMGKAASLRNTQLELLNTFRDQPNLWAGFVLFGNPN